MAPLLDGGGTPERPPRRKGLVAAMAATALILGLYMALAGEEDYLAPKIVLDAEGEALHLVEGDELEAMFGPAEDEEQLATSLVAAEDDLTSVPETFGTAREARGYPKYQGLAVGSDYTVFKNVYKGSFMSIG